MYNLYLKNKSTGKAFTIVPTNLSTGKPLGYAAFAQYILGGEEPTYIYHNVEAGDYEVGVQAVSYAYQGSAFTVVADVIADGIHAASSVNPKNAPAQLYSIDGRSSNGRGHGIFVVKHSDGSVRKVVK
jgi:hypothetical protein